MAVITLLITGLAPAVARAQTPPEKDRPAPVAGEDKARAKVYFERAETLKHSAAARAQDGDMASARVAYAEAAEIYLRAFELFPHAAFQYNAAQMYRLSGKSARAITGYERYLALDPEGDKVADARVHIAELRRDRAARAGSAAGTGDAGGAADRTNRDGEDEGEGDDDEGEDDDDEGEGDDDEGEGDEDPYATRDALPPATAGAARDFGDEDEDEDTGGPLRIGGLVAAAAGAIAFGVGIKYGLDAQSIADELSEPRSRWTLEDRERFAEGERAERNGLILMGIGGAALVTGGVLYLVGRDRDGSEARDRGLGVSAAATSDSASMLLWGRF